MQHTHSHTYKQCYKSEQLFGSFFHIVSVFRCVVVFLKKKKADCLITMRQNGTVQSHVCSVLIDCKEQA